MTEQNGSDEQMTPDRVAFEQLPAEVRDSLESAERTADESGGRFTDVYEVPQVQMSTVADLRADMAFCSDLVRAVPGVIVEQLDGAGANGGLLLRFRGPDEARDAAVAYLADHGVDV